MDGEGAGVDVADRIDQAHHPPGAAQVQPRQRAVAAVADAQVEERVTGEHAVTVRDEPVVEFALLRGGGVQLVPHIRAAARTAAAG